MGFFTLSMRLVIIHSLTCRNPFQGGMGFFTLLGYSSQALGQLCRNPFQGGMGFFTMLVRVEEDRFTTPESQSLSGWDGVFHEEPSQEFESRLEDLRVAIPFRVGWGFSLEREVGFPEA